MEIRRFLRGLVVKSLLFALLFKLISLIISLKYIGRRQTLQNYSVFDIFNLKKPVHLASMELVVDNDFYGIGYSLRRFFKKFSIPYYIEHGVFLGNIIKEDERITFWKKVLVMSPYRKELLEKNSIKATAVGCYIKYAEEYNNLKGLRELKKLDESVILFFPMHSNSGERRNFNFDFVKNRLDSVLSENAVMLACLYWMDVTEENVHYLKKLGFRVCTAGHKNDPYFLSRLKAIISHSDIVVSNDIGTHVGYSVALNKPFFYIKEEIESSIIDVKKVRREKNQRSEENWRTYEKDRDEIIQAFSTFSTEISEDQYSVVDKYWGLKTAEKILVKPEDFQL